MGLDMYLKKRTYIGANYKHNEVGGKIEITKAGKPVNIDLSRISEIEENIGYWRKANQIHNWFVQNVQSGKDDCGEYYVSGDILKKLLSDCKIVLSDRSRAPEIMPAKSGFFFGGTDYDEYYFKDLEETVAICEQAIANNEGGDIYYTSSW